jgi:hypothetical protein
VKKEYLRGIVRKKELDLITIQESKVSNVDLALCSSLWGNIDCDWAFSPAIGRSRGIITIWNSLMASKLFHFSSNGFVGVCLLWGRTLIRIFVVNVYSPIEFD